jgi:Ran GTPase-activating protein (RanGAP) involved in mRNA processing and transport
MKVECVCTASHCPHGLTVCFLGECNEKSRSDVTGIAKLAEVLSDNSSLKFINLCKNKLGNEGKEVLGLKLLQSETSRIEFINTDGWSIKRKDREFNVAHCQLGKSDAFLMAGLLSQNQRLTIVDISGNRIGPDGCKMISRALVDNACITHLDLSVNSLGENYTFPDWRADLTGLAELTTVLQHNKKLTSLNLADNALTGIAHSDDVAYLDGFCTFLEALTSNTHITMLDLSRNELTGVTHYPQLDCLSAIAGMLEQNKTLTRLDISHNNLGIWQDQDGCKILSHSLLLNLSLVMLKLEGNLIAEAGQCDGAGIHSGIVMALVYTVAYAL